MDRGLNLPEKENRVGGVPNIIYYVNFFHVRKYINTRRDSVAIHWRPHRAFSRNIRRTRPVVTRDTRICTIRQNISTRFNHPVSNISNIHNNGRYLKEGTTTIRANTTRNNITLSGNRARTGLDYTRYNKVTTKTNASSYRVRLFIRVSLLNDVFHGPM